MTGASWKRKPLRYRGERVALSSNIPLGNNIAKGRGWEFALRPARNFQVERLMNQRLLYNQNIFQPRCTQQNSFFDCDANTTPRIQ